MASPAPLSQEKQPRELLVTCALVYANGPLHLGHLIESIQADIWVRFQRMQGYRCHFICGSDAHGTPIMIQAAKQAILPEILISQVQASQKAIFQAFSIDFDSFLSTHSEENRVLVNKFFSCAQAKGLIKKREVSQYYDSVKGMFLPDRYVKGECPRCHALDQYGDGCEVCGSTYQPTELLRPLSILSDSVPIEKSSEHYFFDLPYYSDLLKQWIQTSVLQLELRHKLAEWFEVGLTQWDISREAPYFGFLIPGETDKYFYVWLDAPIGYIASFQAYCKQNPDLDFNTFWSNNSAVDLYQFVGKDIVYFHTLFWPALLSAADLRLPTAVIGHGFLTVNGQKMSKSRGTFIEASQYLAHAPTDALRYYYACKLSHKVEDIDLNLDDFVQRINADLVGKWVNIASRCAGFIHTEFEGYLSAGLDDPELYQAVVDEGDNLAKLMEGRDYSQAMRLIMQLADKTNQYIDEKKPWLLKKDRAQKQAFHAVTSMGIHLFYCLMIYLKPIIPDLAKKAEAFLGCDSLSWEDRKRPLLSHRIQVFTPLMVRLDRQQVRSILEKSAHG